AADTDLADMAALVKRIVQAHGSQSVGFAELISAAQEGGLFARVLPDQGEPDRSQRSAFSRMLTRYHKCTFENTRFFIDGKGHQRRYRVEITQF
ncbi:MAG: hypothetical protein KJ072_28680, partial [Verrucomicrobia bacterium]|nr:hypothetical protein [Verrucomicrobiota bacterium]